MDMGKERPQVSSQETKEENFDADRPRRTSEVSGPKHSAKGLPL